MLKMLFPTRALILFLTIGLTDLFSTAYLHSKGMIVELNPLMRAALSYGEWYFMVIKGLTLAVLWVVMVQHARKDVNFVRKACSMGASAYMGLWIVWFFSAR
jgi:uncharacterized protein DUF5658